MTEQINDQISAFIDDELSAEESALLVRRFERDPNAREQALRYSLIGAALRGELLEPHPSVLQRRVAAALRGSAPPVAPARQARRWSTRVVRPLAGLGIAAAVAVAAIGTLRFLNQADLQPAEQLAASAPLQARDAVVAPAYVVPQDTPAGPVVPPPIRLTNYLIHHSEYVSRLGRTSISSNVVGAGVEPTTAPPPEEAEAQWR